MVDGMMQISESDPPTKVFLTPTVPVSCPPCTMKLHLGKTVGLDLDKCDVIFTGIDGEPDARQTAIIDAMNTYSSYSRVARIVFAQMSTKYSGSPWDRYTPAHCPVCSQL